MAWRCDYPAHSKENANAACHEPSARRCGFFAAIGQARANLISNGSFESPPLSPADAQAFAGGSTSITGWTALGSEVILIETTYGEPGHGMTAFNAQDGSNSIDVTGSGNTGPTDGIEQTIATTPGREYTLSFFVGRAESSNGSATFLGPATVDFSLSGGPRIAFTNVNSPPAGFVNWQQFSTTFTASGLNTTISFLNGTSTDRGYAGLDNVVVTEVPLPEPSTGLLFALGLGSLALALRKRADHRNSQW